VDDRRELLVSDGRGLACPLGGFHIDPWRPVKLAVITHAHGDHARPGSQAYICAAPGAEILRRRLGAGAGEIRPVPYGERLRIGDVTVSLHPAGHVLGSAQVRVESATSVWVASGDYKRQADPTCQPFEVVPCDVFITESTFGLPIYRWKPSSEAGGAAGEILSWWDRNRDEGRASVLFCYALGKAQRILAELAALCDRSVYTHGAIEPIVQAYRNAGVKMLPTRPASAPPLLGETPKVERSANATRRGRYAGELVLAPPSAGGSPWMRRFGAGPQFETALASGWMRVRGIRRRRGYDRGFVLSDHADWDDLIRTVRETGAKRVLATHGYTDVLTRYLRAQGLDAQALETPYAAEGEDE
jgi:putative mRNA 3-end processing factor